MKAMRKQVLANDVSAWAPKFLQGMADVDTDHKASRSS